MVVNDLARLGETPTDNRTTVQRLHDAGVEIQVAKESTASALDAFMLMVAQRYPAADAKSAAPAADLSLPRRSALLSTDLEQGISLSGW